MKVSAVLRNFSRTFQKCAHMRKASAKGTSAASARTKGKTDDGGVIVIPNKMKESHAKPSVDAPGLCLANPCRVMLIGGCGAGKTAVLQSMLARGACWKPWEHIYFEDLFHSQSMNVYANDEGDDLHLLKREHYAADAVDGDEPAGTFTGLKAYTKVVQGIPTAGNNFAPGTVYVEIEDVEMLVNYASPAGGQGIVPASQSLKFSELQVATRPLRSSVIAEEVVVPVGTRAVYVTSRQNVHNILADAEELSRAQGGADEVGLITQEAGGDKAGDADTMPKPVTSLQCSIGGVHAPSQLYSDLDTTSGKMARPYADALSVVGKPNGLT